MPAASITFLYQIEGIVLDFGWIFTAVGAVYFLQASFSD
jgi:hypothetical protein